MKPSPKYNKAYVAVGGAVATILASLVPDTFGDPAVTTAVGTLATAALVYFTPNRDPETGKNVTDK